MCNYDKCLGAIPLAAVIRRLWHFGKYLGIKPEEVMKVTAKKQKLMSKNTNRQFQYIAFFYLEITALTIK
jgi:hypothetical protein